MQGHEENRKEVKTRSSKVVRIYGVSTPESGAQASVLELMCDVGGSH